MRPGPLLLLLAAADAAAGEDSCLADGTCPADLAELQRQKAAAVEAEDYHLARRLKSAIDELKRRPPPSAQQVEKLQAQLRAAVADEDFVEAARLKGEIAKLKNAGGAAADDAAAKAAAAKAAADDAAAKAKLAQIKDNIKKLEGELKQAIADEEYVDAARLKKEIAAETAKLPAGGGGGAAAAGAGKARGPAKKEVVQLTDSNFDDEVYQPGRSAFVKFFAPWCGHCKRIAPVWQQMAGEFGAHDKVMIGDFDCTNHPTKRNPLCATYGVQGLPTLKTFRAGGAAGDKGELYKGGRELDDLKAHAEKLAAGT